MDGESPCNAGAAVIAREQRLPNDEIAEVVIRAGYGTVGHDTADRDVRVCAYARFGIRCRSSRLVADCAVGRRRP